MEPKFLENPNFGFQCFYVNDEVKFDRCRAANRLTTGDKCIIRQCQKKPSTVIEGNIFLCKNHLTQYRSGYEIEYFDQVSKDIPKQAQSMGMTDLYYVLNKNYRKQLTEFIDLYDQMKKKLNKRKTTLKKTYYEKKQDFDTKIFEIRQTEMQIMKIQAIISVTDEIKTNSNEKEQQQIKFNELQIKYQELEKELNEIKEELETTQQQNNECDVNLTSMAAITEKLLGTLKNQINNDKEDISQDIPFEMGSQVGLSEEQKQAQFLKMVKQEKENQKQRLLQDGLFVLVRVRCDKPKTGDQLGIIKEANKGPDNFIEIENLRMDIGKSLISAIYDDTFTNTCKEGEFLKELSDSELNRKEAEEIQRKIFFQYDTKTNTSGRTTEKATNMQYFKELESLYLTWIQHEKENSNLFIEFGIEKKEKIINEAKDWALLQNKIGITLEKDHAAMKIKTSDGGILIASKAWKNAQKVLEDFVKSEISSYEKTLQSGTEFVKMSAISFVAKQKEDDLLDAITIVAIGGSGAGKTTTAKALLQYIINTYRDKYPTFIVNSSISITFKQIYENENGELKNKYMSREVPDFVDRGVKYPYLRKQMDDTKAVDALKPNILCGNEEKVKSCSTIVNIQNLEQKNSAIEIMKNVLIFDNETEKNRKIRYTLNNPSGSSRSIKIIQITFKKDSKIININLIDTAGYEDYREEKATNALREFYMDLIADAVKNDTYPLIRRKDSGLGVGGAFVTTTESDESAIKRLVDPMVINVLKEGEFIRSSLIYIENTLLKFNDMQDQIKTQKIPITDKVKKDFEDELLKIKPIKLTVAYNSQGNMIPNTTKEVIQDQSWLVPYLPKHSTVIVLGAFKTNMNSTEISSAKNTLNFLKTLTKV